MGSLFDGIGGFPLAAVHCGVKPVYNDNAVRQMIECIKVYPDGKLDIIFNGGYTIVEHINLK